MSFLIVERIEEATSMEELEQIEKTEITQEMEVNERNYLHKKIQERRGQIRAGLLASMLSQIGCAVSKNGDTIEVTIPNSKEYGIAEAKRWVAPSEFAFYASDHFHTFSKKVVESGLLKPVATNRFNRRVVEQKKVTELA